MVAQAPPRTARVAGVVLAAVGVVVWAIPMTRSLWLDETLTWWVVRDGLGEAIDRALTYQQSPLYYVLVWPFAHLDGANEVLLRIPSLRGRGDRRRSCLARLAGRLLGPASRGVAVLALMGTWATVEASDARPYALALAFAIGSWLALVEALDRPRVRAAAVYGLLVAGMLWAHYLFAVVLLPQVLYAAMRRRRGATVAGARDAAVAAGVALVLLLPLAAQIGSLWSRRQELATGGSSVVLAPFLVANAVVVPAVLVALVVARGKLRFERTRIAADGGVLIVAWAAAPPVALWLVSVVSAPYFINGRYLVSATPGIALLVAWGVAALRPGAAQRSFVVALAVLTPIVVTLWFHRDDDWRSAVRTAATVTEQDTVVLARVRLVEAKQVDWLHDPEKRSYVLAPFSFYPLPVEPIPLPLFPHDPGADVYLEETLDGPVASAGRFVLIEQGDVYRAWLDERLGPLGWSSAQVGSVEEPEVTVFTRA